MIGDYHTTVLDDPKEQPVQESEPKRIPANEEPLTPTMPTTPEAGSPGRMEHPCEPCAEPRAAAPEKHREPVEVRPVQFAQLGESLPHAEFNNIGLIMDVPLQLSVELGRTKKTIKERSLGEDIF